MEQEELLYSYTFTKLSDLLAIKMLLRKIQLTSSPAKASGRWKKTKIPGFFRQLSGMAGWALLAGQPGRRQRHNHVRTRQLED